VIGVDVFVAAMVDVAVKGRGDDEKIMDCLALRSRGDVALAGRS